jgi:hypothetical protein
VDDTSDTIETFCKREKLSRSMFYKLSRQGKAPRTFYIGNRRHISPEARREWRQKREAEAAQVREGDRISP